MTRIVVNAAGVCTFGGTRLLEALFEGLDPAYRYHFFIDHRVALEPPQMANLECERVEISGRQRLAFERRLQDFVGAEDVLFCFNNLPPLWARGRRTVVFVQNRQILEPLKDRGTMSAKALLRLLLLYGLFHWKKKGVERFIVQTQAMQALIGAPDRVEVLPFLPKLPNLDQVVATDYDGERFFYPADGLAHKNHVTLLKAWCVLAGQGLFPKLELTIEESEIDPALAKELRQCGAKVQWRVGLSYHQVLQSYVNAAALIFPSLTESFGLPLVEAQLLGVPVLASDRDFVHESCPQAITFDPLNPQSIAAQVAAHWGQLQPQPRRTLADFKQARELWRWLT